MCETRDLGIRWPQRHTLIFESDRRIDMRYVCPKDVKKMLTHQGRTIYWKRWAAKHENEELKEGIWLEPALALLRKKEDWIEEKHRNVARKLLLEGCWVQNKLFDIGWSGESECQACHKEEGTEKHRPPLPRMARDQKGDPRGCQKVAAKNENLEEGVEVAKTYCYASSQRKPTEQGSFQHEKVGVREAQELGHTSRRVQRPRGH